MSSAPQPIHPDLVERYARGLLVAADALGTVPTPIDDLLAASQLTQAQDLFDLGREQSPHFSRVKRALSKVLGALAIRERIVFVNPEQSLQRQRFVHGHELGHNVMHWHRDSYGYYEDDASTVLAPGAADQLESEADSFSAEILFQLDRFNEAADSYGPGLDVPLALAEDWLTSRHATIRRYVEGSNRQMSLLLLGRFLLQRPDGKSFKILRTFESPSFHRRFGPARMLLPPMLSTTTDPIGQDAYRAWLGLGGSRAICGSASLAGQGKFRYEVYFNQHVVFVLLYPMSRLTVGRTVAAVQLGA